MNIEKLLLIFLLFLAVSGKVSLRVSKGHLVDSRGMSLYAFQPDHQGQSTCNGNCAVFWPPLLSSNFNAAGDMGVHANLVGKSKRKSGSFQVTYNKWPLYYFIRDKKPGDTFGQRLVQFGGVWNLVSTSGKRIV